MTVALIILLVFCFIGVAKWGNIVHGLLVFWIPIMFILMFLAPPIGWSMFLISFFISLCMEN